MSATREALKKVRRPTRPVTLPGGTGVHVLDLTVAELRKIDALAESVPAGEERAVRTLTLMAAFALADEDGSPAFPELREPGAAAADLADMDLLSPAQIRAVVEAAVPTKESAGKA